MGVKHGHMRKRFRVVVSANFQIIPNIFKFCIWFWPADLNYIYEKFPRLLHWTDASRTIFQPLKFFRLKLHMQTRGRHFGHFLVKQFQFRSVTWDSDNHRHVVMRIDVLISRSPFLSCSKYRSNKHIKLRSMVIEVDEVVNIVTSIQTPANVLPSLVALLYRLKGIFLLFWRRYMRISHGSWHFIIFDCNIQTYYSMIGKLMHGGND